MTFKRNVNHTSPYSKGVKKKKNKAEKTILTTKQLAEGKSENGSNSSKKNEPYSLWVCISSSECFLPESETFPGFGLDNGHWTGTSECQLKVRRQNMSSPASSLQPGPWSSRGRMESHLHLVILEDGTSPAGRCCPVGKWEAADPGPEGFAVRVAFSCHRDGTVLSSDLIFCRWLCEDCPG